MDNGTFRWHDGTGWDLGAIWALGVVFRLCLALVLPALRLLTFNSCKTRHYLCSCVDLGNVNLLLSHLLNLIKTWKAAFCW